MDLIVENDGRINSKSIVTLNENNTLACEKLKLSILKMGGKNHAN